MTPTERRLRVLEAAAGRGVLRQAPRIVVQPGETVDEVLARDGVSPLERQRRGSPTLIVRQIVDPVTVIDAVAVADARNLRVVHRNSRVTGELGGVSHNQPDRQGFSSDENGA